MKINSVISIIMEITEEQKKLLGEDNLRILSVLGNIANDNKVIIRLVGGAPRDILMKKTDIHDLDMTVNNNDPMGISGRKFMEILENPIMKSKYDYTVKCNTIDANELASRTLETGTCHFHFNDGKSQDASLDFVGLRKEVYTDVTSRIPTIRHGTPEEDAFRRDLTINSIFLRLNDWKFEDYTEFGFYDIEHKILRCPKKPFDTFKDDPLRVVRILRFASVYKDDGFSLDESIDHVLTDFHEELKNSFIKLSRERIYVEINKTINKKKFNTLIVISSKYPSVFELIFGFPFVHEYINIISLNGLLCGFYKNNSDVFYDEIKELTETEDKIFNTIGEKINITLLSKSDKRDIYYISNFTGNKTFTDKLITNLKYETTNVVYLQIMRFIINCLKYDVNIKICSLYVQLNLATKKLSEIPIDILKDIYSLSNKPYSNEINNYIKKIVSPVITIKFKGKENAFTKYILMYNSLNTLIGGDLYHQKYIKYKTKYLTLRSKIGFNLKKSSSQTKYLTLHSKLNLNSENKPKLDSNVGGSSCQFKYMNLTSKLGFNLEGKYLNLCSKINPNFENSSQTGGKPFCCVDKDGKCIDEKFIIPNLKNKKYAIVTLLMISDSYLPAVLTLGYSIRKISPELSKQVDLVCMVTPDISEQARKDILTIYDKIIEINYIEIKPENIRHKDIGIRKIYGKSFTRINCLKLTQYKKIISIDADSIIVKPEFFSLFSLKTPAGVYRGCTKLFTSEGVEKFNKLYCNEIRHGKKIDPKFIDESTCKGDAFIGVEAALLVLKPNIKDYNGMIEMMNRLGNKRILNGDTALFTYYYKNKWYNIDLRFDGGWTNPTINPEIIIIDLYGNQGKPWDLDKVKSISNYPDVKYWISTYKKYYDEFFKEHCNHHDLEKLMNFYKELK